MKSDELYKGKFIELKSYLDVIFNSGNEYELTDTINKTKTLIDDIALLISYPAVDLEFKSFFGMTYHLIANTIYNLYDIMTLGLESIVKACYKQKCYLYYDNVPVLTQEGEYKNYSVLRDEMISRIENKDFKVAFALYHDLQSFYKKDKCFIILKYLDTEFISRYLKNFDIDIVETIRFFEMGMSDFYSFHNIKDRFHPVRSYFLSKYIELCLDQKDYYKALELIDVGISYDLVVRNGNSYEKMKERVLKKVRK